MTATIASGQTKSAPIELKFGYITSIGFPAAMTGTAVSFEGIADPGGTYKPIYLGAAAYSEAVVANVSLRVDSSVFAGYHAVKIVSNAAEAADRSLDITIARS
jgi:hypothetical protein